MIAVSKLLGTRFRRDERLIPRKPAPLTRATP
jgi:hypothetical protein